VICSVIAGLIICCIVIPGLMLAGSLLCYWAVALLFLTLDRVAEAVGALTRWRTIRADRRAVKKVLRRWERARWL
jgi:hypothetical protein